MRLTIIAGDDFEQVDLRPSWLLSLEAEDGSTVTYKPLDTARGPMFQVQSKTGPGDTR